MPLVPGLSPNIRIQAPEQPSQPGEDEVVVMNAPEGEDIPKLDGSGNTISIEHPDGSITISLGGVLEPANKKGPTGWFDNLVDDIDEGQLSKISEDLLRGIRDDVESRREWIEDRAVGMRLLGLKVEVPAMGGSADGAPVEGMSRVRHPLLLEAVLRFQANARSELLPTDGPVKIRNDDNNATMQEDALANDLEKDLNHYLTAVASEYYPDTDRMLLLLGFGGTSFKKVYYCPIRNRPVSESVDADDLIVNNAATDLRNSKRITHRVFMRPSVVKRLQILGIYKDVTLSAPNQIDLDSLQREKASQQGIAIESDNPDDRDREIYECYCELDIKGFEHKHKGSASGLEIPYRVTIDLSTKKVLSIVRNYDEDTKELPEARTNFVKYTFTPGFGFYDIGLLHILGNTTNAITAAWRELLDAGMYSNFPGFLYADTGARQNTNIFRVPPGGGALIKTGGMPINQAVMPLPYKEPSQALMALVENMAETGMRIGGTSEQQVGEGRADAPVGTTLAMIEQATKILNSVHKRLHAAQAEEFQLLVDVFREHPESFWQGRRKMARKWDEKAFLDALENCDLVPQADPNTASHSQRIMKIMALKQLQQAQPGMYDPIAIDKAALKAIGWSNPEQFMAPASAQGKMPPEMQEKIAKIQIEKQDADTRSKVADAKIAETQAKMQGLAGGMASGGQVDGGLAGPELDLKHRELDLKQQDIEARAADAAADASNREADREARLRVEGMRLMSQRMESQESREHEHAQGQYQRGHNEQMQARDHAIDQAKHILTTVAKGRSDQMRAMQQQQQAQMRMQPPAAPEGED